MTDQSDGIGAPKKVLVIDDHVLFREGLISLFRTLPDFQIVGEAGNVHEGIENARALRPDIILMDFSLPDGTGLDATKAILREIPDCKIVFPPSTKRMISYLPPFEQGQRDTYPKMLPVRV